MERREPRPPTNEAPLRLGPMAYGGETVARMPSGQVVFVSGGLPDEEVVVRMQSQQRGVMRGVVQTLQTASPDRVVPRCPYFGPCGGCQWQHASYEAQLDYKQTLLRDALEHQTKLDVLPLRAPVPAPDPWYYRYTAQFHITPEGQLGFVRARSRNILPVAHCYVVHPAIDEALTSLQEFVPAALADDPAGRQLREIALRVATDGDTTELLLVCYGGEAARPVAEQVALRFASRHENVRGGWFVTMGDTRSHSQARDLIVGRATLRQRINTMVFRIGPTVFFQVNPDHALSLIQVVREHVHDTRPTKLLDLFCGVGLFTLSVADLVENVGGADNNEAAIDLAHESAMESGIENARFLAASAEEALSLHSGPDAVILDPPRTGLSRLLMAELVNRKPRALIYVSCDPTTLARDVAELLKAGYRLDSVQMVDLFPQTYHIEAVALLTLR